MAVGRISGGKYTALRVVATAIPISLAMGITIAVFWGVPAVNGALKLAIKEGGTTFMLLVLLPAFAMAAVTTVLAAKILWNASGPQNLNHDDGIGNDSA